MVEWKSKLALLNFFFFLANLDEQTENLKVECNLAKSEISWTTDDKKRLEQIYGNGKQQLTGSQFKEKEPQETW